MEQTPETRLLAVPPESSLEWAHVGDIIANEPGEPQERVVEVIRTQDGRVTLLVERVSH